MTALHPHDFPLDDCASCGARIRWARKNGRRMPIEPFAFISGTLALDVRMVAGVPQIHATESSAGEYRAHLCEAQKRRKGADNAR